MYVYCRESKIPPSLPPQNVHKKMYGKKKTQNHNFDSMIVVKIKLSPNSKVFVYIQLYTQYLLIEIVKYIGSLLWISSHYLLCKHVVFSFQWCEGEELHVTL